MDFLYTVVRISIKLLSSAPHSTKI